jgi:hypothetical protein
VIAMSANQGQPGGRDQTRREVVRQQQIAINRGQQAMQANRAPKVQLASDKATEVEEPETKDE